MIPVISPPVKLFLEENSLRVRDSSGHLLVEKKLIIDKDISVMERIVELINTRWYG